MNQQSIINHVQRYVDRAVTKSTEQIITAEKVFPNHLNLTKATVNNNIDVSGTVNNFDVSELNNTALFINRDAVIPGAFTFNYNVSISADVTVDRNINGISLDDVVTIDKPQNITGRKTFQKMVFASATNKKVSVGKHVNGIDVQDIMLLDKTQSVSAVHSYLGQVDIKADLEVSGFVNNIKIIDIAADTLMKNKDDVVTAYKTLSKAHINGDLQMAKMKTVNDVDVSEMKKNGIFLNADDFFNETVTFHGNVTFRSDVSLGGNLNDKNVTNFVFTDQPSTITAPMTFKENVTFNQPLTVHGNINNLNISG